MKYFKYILVLCLVGCSTSSQHTKIELDGKNYGLAFADEFNGTEIDLSKWTHRIDSKHWSTQRIQNTTLGNGFLYLNLKKEKALKKDYTGAGLISVDTFQYGYYEAKIKIPDAAGWHTSFWLMKYNNIGTTEPISAEIEIDIVENDSKNPSGYNIAFHKWMGGHESVFGEHVKTPNMASDFFTAGCLYTPNKVIYYRNGKVVKTLNINTFKKGPVNIWLTSIASHLGGTEVVEDAKLPTQAVFDYIRFYRQLK